MPTPVRRSRQSELQSGITQFIIERDLRPGDPMPSELDLIAEFGVGRNAIREAMKVLQAHGIVEIRHGFGTYVGTGSLTAMEPGLQFRAALSVGSGLGQLRNLLDVREALEIGLAGRVVAELRPEDHQRLLKIVVAMEDEAAAGRYFPELDWKFHESLYLPMSNDLVLELLRVFWRVFGEVEADLPGARYSPADAARWHRDILTALRDGDRAAVTEAVGTHFADIRERLDRIQDTIA